MNDFPRSDRPETSHPDPGTTRASIPAEEVEQVLRLAAQFSVQPDTSPVPVTDLISAAEAARIPPECVEQAIAQVCRTQARRQQMRRFWKRSVQTLMVGVVAIAAALVTEHWRDRTAPLSNAPIDVPGENNIGTAPTVRTIDAHSGWQVLEFDQPVSRITRIAGAGSVYRGYLAPVGAGRHGDGHAWRSKPRHHHGDDAKPTASTLQVELNDKTSHPVVGPMALPAPVRRLRMRVDHGVRLKVYFD
ncbi:MAG: hypothetical protein ACFB8W_12595 [Elainellaceae cyanobacterium]